MFSFRIIIKFSEFCCNINLPNFDFVLGSMYLKVTNITDCEQIWKVFQINAICTPYQQYDWLKPWYDYIAHSIRAQPKIILGYSANDKLIFILPLMLREKFGVIYCEWLGGKVQNINSGLYDPDWLTQCDENCFNEVLKLIQDIFCQVDVFDFSYNPQGLYGCKNPFFTNRFTNKSIHLLFEKNLVQFKKSGKIKVFDGKTNRRNRKRFRQLEAQFEDVKVMNCNSRTENTNALEAFLKFSADRFPTKGIANEFSSYKMQAFLKAVSENGVLKFKTIEAENITIAVLGYLKYNDYWSGFIQSVDTRTLTKGSPGKFLLHSFIEDAFADNVDLIDIGLGKEPYKQAHFDAVQMHDVLIAYSIKGNLAKTYLLVKRGTMRQIRDSNVLWPLVVKLRKLKGKLI